MKKSLNKWLIELLVLIALVGTSISNPTPTKAIIGGSFDSTSRLEVVKIQTSRWTCTGTLISRTLVLTAAHCLWDHKAQSYLPDLASATIGTEDGINGRSGAISQLISAVKHPDYNGLDGQNDVGIVQVADVFNGVYAELATASETFASEQIFAVVTASGFGVTRQNGSASSNLLQVTQQLLSPTYCNQRWNYGIAYSDSFICASGTPLNTVCTGDSGGALFVIVGGKRKLAGVTNFGTTTCGLGMNVFGRISSHLSFLSNNGFNLLNRATPSLPALPPAIEGSTAPGLPTRPVFESTQERSIILPKFTTSRLFQLVLNGSSRCSVYVDGPLALRGIPTSVYIGRKTGPPIRKVILDEFGDFFLQTSISCRTLRQQGVFLSQPNSLVKIKTEE